MIDSTLGLLEIYYRYERVRGREPIKFIIGVDGVEVDYLVLHGAKICDIFHIFTPACNFGMQHRKIG